MPARRFSVRAFPLAVSLSARANCAEVSPLQSVYCAEYIGCGATRSCRFLSSFRLAGFGARSSEIGNELHDGANTRRYTLSNVCRYSLVESFFWSGVFAQVTFVHFDGTVESHEQLHGGYGKWERQFILQRFNCKGDG